MRAKELKALNVDELKTKLLDLRKEQFSLRMKRANGSLDKFHQFKIIRRAIARIKTMMTEKTRVGETHGK